MQPPACPLSPHDRLQTVIVTHVPDGPRALAKVELEELYVRLCDMHTELEKHRSLAQTRASTLSEKQNEIVDLKSTYAREAVLCAVCCVL